MKKLLSRRHFIFYFTIPTFLFIFISPDRDQAITNYLYLLTQPANLLNDTFAIAGPAATFLNTTILLIFLYFLVRNAWAKVPNGMQFAATGIYVGHSYFGINLLNAFPIFLGMYLYSKWTNQSFKRFTTVSVFASASVPMTAFFLSRVVDNQFYLLAFIVIGLLIGFISAPLAEHFLKFHQGFSLYNLGFTTGMIATFFAIFFPYFNWKIPNQTALSNQYHSLISWYYLSCFVIFFLAYISNYQNANKEYSSLLKRSGRLPDDFFANFDFSTISLNILVTGLSYFVILIMFKTQLNGPLLGGLFTIVGFSAFGKHVKNTLPVSIGVLLAAFLLNMDLASTSVMIIFLFSTALAPIAGYYGIFAGLIAGFIHFNLTVHVFQLHYGLTLYNNGFSSGFVAAFLVPIIDTIIDHHPNKL